MNNPNFFIFSIMQLQQGKKPNIKKKLKIKNVKMIHSTSLENRSQFLKCPKPSQSWQLQLLFQTILSSRDSRGQGKLRTPEIHRWSTYPLILNHTRTNFPFRIFCRACDPEEPESISFSNKTKRKGEVNTTWARCCARDVLRLDVRRIYRKL